MPQRPLAVAAMSLASVFSLLASGGVARAQNASSQAAAQALFDEARALMSQGKFADACPKFAESERLDPGAGTLLNLANCYEKNGQSASAWVTFKDAAAAADVKHRADWSQRARDRAVALEPSLSRLVIQVAPEARAEGLEVRRDGVAVGPAEWGTPIPVDPGDHVIEASAPRKRRWSSRTRVGATGDRAVVSVPALEDDAVATVAVVAPPAVVGPPAVLAPADLAPPSEASHTREGSAQRTAGIVIAGAGLAGVAVGSVFGVVAMGKVSDANDRCPTGPTCTNADGVRASDDAKSAATVSTIAFVAGGAALAAGAILFFTAPKSGGREAQAKHMQVTPIVGIRTAGLTVGGAW